MSDQRGDNPGPDHDPDHPTDPEYPAGERPPPSDDFEIAEMSPPPTPAAADEPTAVGGPIVPPPDTDPAGTEPGDPATTPPPAVPVGPGVHPASTDPLVREDGAWPSSAKATVAVLVVLALLGVAGTIFGLARASSAEDDADEAEAELATAQDRIVALEDQLASLGDESGTMSERLDQLTAERDQAVAERDQAVAERDTAIAERDEQLAIAEAERALLEDQIAELEGEIALLEEALGQLDGQFPLTYQFDLGQLDIDGNYAVSFTEIGCTGLELCGSPPATTTATISSAGGLRLVAPDLLDVPLVVVGGTPFGVADSESLVPPCGDTPRPTALTMALFDDAVEIDEEGAATVTALGATIVVDAPATEACEIGRVWYRAELTRQG